jgi:hypothetical protein
MPISILRTSDGKLDQANQQDFDALAGRLAAQPSKVLLHLHGGLVNEAAGLETAHRLSGAAPEGFGLGPDWEQIYIVWRTGALETLKTNWQDLFNNDRIYHTVLKKLIGFVGSKLELPGVTGRSAFAAVNLTPAEIEARLRTPTSQDPFADVDVQIERDTPTGRGPVVAPQSDAALAQEFSLSLQLDPEFMSAADNVSAALTFDPLKGRSIASQGDTTKGSDDFKRLDERIKKELTDAVPAKPAGRDLFTAVEVAKFLIKHAAAITLRVIRRFRTRRDHGFYPTIVEELVREMYGDIIGAAIWGMMKKDAADHFVANGCGTALIRAFEASRPSQLCVSGHSAGSIWAAALIRALASMANPPDVRLAFLAPAVRMDEFADVLQLGTPFVKAFRMFTMNDELERKDAVLGPGTAAIYPCSLLYVISGVLEDERAEAFPDAPIVGMQRFLGSDPAWLTDPRQIASAHAVLNFLTSPNHGVVYATTQGNPGLSSLATSHGAFDDDQMTLASVVTFFG